MNKPISPGEASGEFAHPPSKVEVREVGDVTVLELTGSFLMPKDCNPLREKMEESLRTNKKKLLLNWRDNERWSENTCAAMLWAHQEVSQKGGEVKFVVVSEEHKKVLRVTRMDKWLGVYPSEAEGLASFTRTAKDTIG